ncbi:kinase-like domain-containing protein, partial [Cokeromyces recurvatus]|uniref:kinase-like domain-containing protein n=1 Tax=Cokeromyces recurvatus TaxID=90255 RepID=UPI002220BCCC
FFHTLTKRKKKKTNSELLEAYLYQCLKGTIGRSSLFRDFLSIQRDEDRIISKSAVRQLVSQQHHHVSQSSSIHHEKRILCESLPPSPPSSISITQFPDYQEDCPDRQHEIIPKKSKSIQDYQFINVLGKGATGKVILVKEKSSNDNQLFALKAITKSWNITKREVNHIRMERNILATISSLHHPFLIQLHSAFQDQHSLYLVLAYHAGADLATLLQRYICFPPEQCRLYAAEIVMGLQELHRNFILYRDLKPENVLLAADGHIVLTDFGLSKMFNDNNHFDHRTTTFCGTPEYLAPEVILQEEEYSYAADLWSLGIMLYEMISGIIPFAASTPADMYERVLYDDLVFPEHCFARDPEVVDLISGLLEKDPLNRLGAGLGGVFELRNHAYFINHLNWRDVYRKRTQPIYVPYRLCETDLSHFDTDFLNMSTSVFDKEEDIQLHSGLYPAGLSEDAFRGYSYYHDDDDDNSQSCNDNGSESFFFDKDEDYSDYQYFNSSSMSDLEEEEEEEDDIIDVPTSKLSYYYSPTIICNKTLKRKRSMIMDSSSFSYL